MKFLILAANYPNNNGGRVLQYIHTRNIFYKQANNEVVVLNFAAKDDYIIDGIKVITNKSYQKNYSEYNFDLLICHAANIRNHYIFLKKYNKNFNKIVFFFHGHEVLNLNKVYPKPYSFKKYGKIKTLSREIYDNLKLYLWRKYFQKIAYKSHFIFVSNWIYTEFCKWVKLDSKYLKDRYSIIHNSIGQNFETITYDNKSYKKYDFITIRSDLDGSKYCVDVVNELAKANPKYSFCLIGKGKFFEYFEKAPNITWINETLSHKDIINYLNISKYALMPTRQDTQGLMACEMVSFGMPLITSNISVCHEILDDFKNVRFIENDFNIDLDNVIKSFDKSIFSKNEKYFQKNTCSKELEIFDEIINGKKK